MTARRPARVLPVVAVTVLTLSACGSGDDDALREQLDAAAGGDEDTASVEVPVEVSSELVDREGTTVGRVWFRDTDVGTEVEVEVAGLTQGFHPMYLYDTGICDTESPPSDDPGVVGPFVTAGDVVQELPSVLVLANGEGSTTTLAGPMPLEELLEEDGTALVVTEAAESLADIPPPPAAPVDPDAEAPVVEDTGSRVACGAIGGEDA
ncbi:Cu-Zn family superoxide dismutase [Blastococcus colisei]|uniref:Cu-Zn family superoxide dismutase n=1 Tax=Blastococcus colisei TaxID=1564162 RepID=A0A543PEX9_9ACTN|nr:superoxide dismutase family protein [Blastococcus colisei]TQN42616.1 Cu-Zn family superoxide dismutase [Blastococcus colisei]